MNTQRGFRLFLLLWTGELISAIGTGLSAFALTAVAYEQTGDASSSARVLLLSFLPSYLLRPLGGFLADRFDRRFIMVAGNCGAALACLWMTGQSLDTAVGIQGLYPGIAVISLFSGLLHPAYKSSVSDLLPENLYSRAAGLVQLAGAAPLLISPLAAGILMTRLDLKSVLFADFLSFALSAGFILAVFLKAGQFSQQEAMAGAWKEELASGWRTVVGHKGILQMVLVVSALLFFVSLLQTLLTPMVLTFSDVLSLGALKTLCALGVLFGSLIIGLTGMETGRIGVLSGAIAVLGMSFAFIGMKENFWMIAVPGFLFFLTLPFVNAGIEVLIRRNIDNRFQGRAWGLVSFISSGGAVLAFGTAGILSDDLLEPLFRDSTRLPQWIYSVFGAGPGRGSAFLFFISGIFVLILSGVIGKSASIRKLEGRLS